jgi:hypothetical protein
MPQRKPFPRIDRDREKMVNIIRRHMKMMPSMVDEALKKTVNEIAKEMTTMDTKEQALKKALEYLMGDFKEGGRICGTKDNGKEIKATLYSDSGKAIRPVWSSIFPYAQSKEAPPQGSIVEVWMDKEEERVVAYSCGELDGNGHLYADEEYLRCSGAGNSCAWPNWRVIKVAGK